MEDLSSANVPVDNYSAHPSAKVAPDLQPSAQVSAQAPAASPGSTSDTSYVTSGQFSALSDKMAEQFARFEVTFSLLQKCLLIRCRLTKSNTPFLDPNLARLTGPVWLPG